MIGQKSQSNIILYILIVLICRRQVTALAINKSENQTSMPESKKTVSSVPVPLPKGIGICLDLGAGQTRMKELISNRGLEWVGLDITRCKGLTIVADAHNLPFREGTFDVVYMNAVMEHLHHPNKVLSESNRILKTSGTLCGWVAFLEPYHGSYYHFTFLGLEVSLIDSGFTNLHIWAEPHFVNALIQNFLPMAPKHLRETLTKIFASMHMKIGIWYLKHSMTNIDGVPVKDISANDILLKFAEGYSFSCVKQTS
jgi:SAM-dependent methyltransferase